jgi:hypothetical protein
MARQCYRGLFSVCTANIPFSVSSSELSHKLMCAEVESGSISDGVCTGLAQCPDIRDKASLMKS